MNKFIETYEVSKIEHAKKLHSDGSGIPTIGLGKALIKKKKKGYWKPIKKIDEVIPNITKEQRALLQKNADLLNQGKIKEANDFIRKNLAGKIKISNEKIYELYELEEKEVEKRIERIARQKVKKLNISPDIAIEKIKFLKQEKSSLHEALVSLNYNLGSTPKTIEYILKDDFKSAFKEVLINSNSGNRKQQAGIASRRIAEAEPFLKQIPIKSRFDFLIKLEKDDKYKDYFNSLRKDQQENLKTNTEKWKKDSAPLYFLQSIEDEKGAKKVLKLMKKTINRKGRKTAIRGLQRGLDTINGYTKDAPDPYKRPLLEDGILGQKTRRTLLSAIQNHGVKKVKNAYQSGQISIALKDNRDKRFSVQKQKIEEAYKNTSEDNQGLNNNFYIWKTVGDSRVRGSHENRDGKKYSFFRPPDGGHPGQDFGCRCYVDVITE